MNDGWIEWRGGTTRPVAADVPVAVKFRDGVVWRVFPACELSWHHSGKGDDIIAYRVAEPEATAPTSPAFDRVAACIALRVPESGIPELDALIAKAQRRDIAVALHSKTPLPWGATEAADKLLAQLEQQP